MGSKYTRWPIALSANSLMACQSLSCAIGMALAVPAVAMANSVSFDIASQPLPAALQVFASQAKMQVLYQYDAISDVNSNPINGELETRAALEQLLKGTGLEVVYSSDTSVTIRKTKSKDDRAKALLEDADKNGALAQHNVLNRFAQAGEDRYEGVGDVAGKNDEGSQVEKLEEVVVTAQKRLERLQDVPISIGVLTGDELAQGTRTVQDALTRVAGVSMTPFGPGDAKVTIRGVAQVAAGNVTSAYYLDEAPFAGLGVGSFPDLNSFDLQRVEVLRGPQGTLFGASALAGAVRVLTNDADVHKFALKARGNASATDKGGDNTGGDIAINVPLVDGVFAIRGVASYSKDSGFIDRSDGVKDVNDALVNAYRLSATFQPTDEFQMRFKYHHSDIRYHGANSSDDNYDTVIVNPGSDYKYDVYNLIADYDFGGFSALSSTSFLERSVLDVTSFFYSPLNKFINVETGGSLKSFNQELRLTSSIDGPWRWSAGASYQNNRSGGSQAAPEVFPFPFSAPQESKNFAVFGELVRSFADDRFEITGGLRYYNDENSAAVASLFFGPPFPPKAFAKFDKLTGRVVLSYKPSENRMFYVSAGNGFRSGQPPSPQAIQINPVFNFGLKPDTLYNYEVGTKGSLIDGALGYDAAVYYLDWQNIQQLVTNSAGTAVRVNAGTARGPGAEITLTLAVSNALDFYVNGGWNDLKFTDDIVIGGALSPTPIPLFQKGARVNDSAAFNAAAGGSYRVASPIDDVDFVLSADFTHRSNIRQRTLRSLVVNNRQSDNISSLNMKLDLAAEHWTFGAYATNLLNSDARVSVPDIDPSSTAVHMKPRTIGLQASYNYR